VKLGDIAGKITDGEHITPRRTSEGYYLLSARNIQNGHLALDDVDHIPTDEYERIIKRCNPEDGDIFDILLRFDWASLSGSFKLKVFYGSKRCSCEI